MARTLDVYLHDVLAGHLVQDDSGRLSFTYTRAWLGSPDSAPLSRSLPLRDAPFDDRACRPFFAGLLPEAEMRERVARALGITPRNDFALLDRIGGECAGAITFRHPGEPPPTRPGPQDYEALPAAELEATLQDLPRRPLLAGREGVRLSLAGAQDKLPVLVIGEDIALPLNGAPSSHILKPQITAFPDTVGNEAFCLWLAKRLGLHAVEADIRRVGDERFLLVARYDRTRRSDGSLARLHQEDFCQALGFPPEFKYQNEGGPSLAQCFDLVRASSARPVIDLARLLDAVVLNFLIGNRDAHGKNLSLLYADRGPELAPLYDISCTEVYPELDRRMAMKIGDKYDPTEVMPRHWERFAHETGLAAPMVRRRILDLAVRLPVAAIETRQTLGDRGLTSPVIDGIVEIIRRSADAVQKDLRGGR